MKIIKDANGSNQNYVFDSNEIHYVGSPRDK